MLTKVCKLQPTQKQVKQIDAELSGFTAACNYINNMVNSKQTKKYQQSLNYNISRVTIDRVLSGNMVVASLEFYQLRQVLEYKKIQASLRLIKVNYACTSATCHKSNHIHPKKGKSYRNAKNFARGHCGWQGDVESSESLNISAQRASVNRLGCSGLSCSKSKHLRATRSPRHTSAAHFGYAIAQVSAQVAVLSLALGSLQANPYT
jgi:Putative transposase DNA-binding domain